MLPLAAPSERSSPGAGSAPQQWEEIPEGERAEAIGTKLASFASRARVGQRWLPRWRGLSPGVFCVPCDQPRHLGSLLCPTLALDAKLASFVPSASRGSP